MLLRGQQNTGKIQDVSFSAPSSPFATAYTALPRRNSLTAKSRTRKMAASDHKTISINADPSTPTGMPNIASNHSEQLLPNSSFSFHSNPSALNQFDNLHIEDFLKSYIVGAKKAEDKSNEIIRSLNGTWFKNMQSTQVPANKLYNNLGIRRSKFINHRAKEWVDAEAQRRHFSKEYRPPNIFPGKKIGSKQSIPSKGFIETDYSRSNMIDPDSPLKINILRRTNSPSRTSSPQIRRSRSQFEKKKSQPIADNQALDISQGVVKGQKMKLHKD